MTSWSDRIAGERCVIRHAVNSRSELARLIASSANLAEGDVLLGTLDGGEDAERAIMGHPPARRSDLSFDDWVSAALLHGYALKVDLKTAAVIEPALAILVAQGFTSSRLMFNADIFRGPGGGAPLFSLEHLERCREAFPGAAISIGCTTGPRAGGYLEDVIDQLIAGAQRVGTPVTIALRAEAVLANDDGLRRICAAGHHVSIWNDFPSFAATPELSRDFRRRLPDGLLDLRDADGVSV